MLSEPLPIPLPTPVSLILLLSLYRYSHSSPFLNYYPSRVPIPSTSVGPSVALQCCVALRQKSPVAVVCAFKSLLLSSITSNIEEAAVVQNEESVTAQIEESVTTQDSITSPPPIKELSALLKGVMFIPSVCVYLFLSFVYLSICVCCINNLQNIYTYVILRRLLLLQ